MQKLYAMCILVASAAADRCSGAICEGTLPHGRSLLQKDAASSFEQNYGAIDDDRDIAAETDEKKKKSLTTSVDLDVNTMEGEVASMREKMKVVEETLGTAPKNSGTAGGKKEEASLQQITNESSDSLQARMSSIETNVADLLSRTIGVEMEVGVAQVAQASWLDISNDPAMGLANRAIAAKLKVHNLQGRISKMEHTVVDGLKPDATLLKKEVDILEGKVNTLNSSVQGPASSLLGIGSSSDDGVKSQVSQLEMRVGELLSTTATLETEVHGLSNKIVSEEALFQKEKTYVNQGLVPRVSVLKDKVSNLKSRVFTLEHHVTGL